MFTDLVDSTGVKMRLGDLAYAENVARPHNQIFRAILAKFPSAHEVNYTGDGFFVAFDSVVHAVEVALLFHQALRRHSWVSEAVKTRIGIHAGESVILDEGGERELTITSHAADSCARLTSLARGGQTLLTRGVFDDARQYVRVHPRVEGEEPPALGWAAHGPYLFKGKDEPVDVFEVGAIGYAPLLPPLDVEKARRAIRPGEEETLGWRPAQGIEIPDRIGWYLTERLGEGGFGEVWLAEHTRLRQRRVFKFCFDEQRLRSFKRELTLFRLIRDALGDRPDIARLHDVKLDAPPFFLESEYAEHGNLVKWCEDQGGVAAVPMSRRLEIIAAVAEAAGAAHSIGILHKDIKPQNVLMQGRERGTAIPQLADFGIGALSDREALAEHSITAAGFTVNTLVSDGSGSSSGITRLYAPPEQLSGKPYTVQGDIFAIGVMLYQIVIGDFRRAIATGWERDVEDPILREDIASCVDGQPARRLSSANELATRLRSIEQRRAEAARLQEQNRMAEELAAAEARVKAERERAQRTRVVASVVSLLAIAAIAAGVAAQREKNRARAAESVAESARQRADEQRQIALTEQSRAERGEVAADEAKKKALDARKAADELIRYMQYDLHAKLDKIGQLHLIDGINGRVKKYREDYPAEVGDLVAEREMGITLSQRGDLLSNRGQLAEAHEAFQQALAIAERLVAAEPGNLRWKRDHASAYIKISDVLRGLSKLEAAREAAEKSREIAEALARLDPNGLDPQWDLANAFQRRGDALREMKRAEDALADYRECLAIRKRGAVRLPVSIQWQRAISTIEVSIGDLLRDLGRPDEALEYFADSRAIRERLAAKEPDNAGFQSDLCWGHDRLGDVLFDQGKLDGALRAFQESVRLRERLVQSDPENAGWLRDLAIVVEKVGEIAFLQQRWADAAEAFDRELAMARPWLAKPNTETTWISLFGRAAGRRWEILRSAPATSASIDRDAALEDLQEALRRMRDLKTDGQLPGPMEKRLAWLESLAERSVGGG